MCISGSSLGLGWQCKPASQGKADALQKQFPTAATKGNIFIYF